MVYALWDASALAKRYAAESGSDVVDAIFAEIPLSQCVSTAVGYAEVYSILIRKFNRGVFDRAAFVEAKSALQSEVSNGSDFVLLSISDEAFYSGVTLMEAYNLNSTDAALLSLFRSFIQTFASDGPAKFVIVAADARLVRAVELEGIAAIDPETITLAGIKAFLASL